MNSGYGSVPSYLAKDLASGNMGGGFGNSFRGANALSGVQGILGGLFNDSSAPYEAASNEYAKYGNMAQGTQQPFLDAGTSAIPKFQSWLSNMQNPSDFINHLMGQYQESPWAKYQQQQGIRAATNLGSASGLTGSTPLQLQAQQNAQNISSEDMGNWLQRVLGINTQYGAGQQGLIGTGQTSANALTSMYNELGQRQAEAKYGEEAGKNQDFSNLLGGGLELAASFL